MNPDPKNIALAYIHACGRKDLDTVASLLAPEVRFVGPGNDVSGAAAYLAVLRRLGAVWERSEVKHVFVDGRHVCHLRLRHEHLCRRRADRGMAGDRGWCLSPA